VLVSDIIRHDSIRPSQGIAASKQQPPLQLRDRHSPVCVMRNIDCEVGCINILDSSSVSDVYSPSTVRDKKDVTDSASRPEVVSNQVINKPLMTLGENNNEGETVMDARLVAAHRNIMDLYTYVLRRARSHGIRVYCNKDLVEEGVATLARQKTGLLINPERRQLFSPVQLPSSNANKVQETLIRGAPSEL